MNDEPGDSFLLDGQDVPFRPGDTILQAARRAGAYIPHLCWHPDFRAHGSCRICIVRVNGRAGAACTVLAAPGQEEGTLLGIIGGDHPAAEYSPEAVKVLAAHGITVN